MITEIISSFEGENMQTQGNVLSYRTDLCFHDYKLATELMKVDTTTKILTTK